MNPIAYKRCVSRVLANPVLLSGVRLGKRVKLFQAMQYLKHPCDINTLASELHLKEPYLKELIHSYVSSEVMTLTPDKKIIVPDWTIFKEAFLDPELTYLRPFEKVAPILEKCFEENGPAGYTHDEAPYVLDYVRTLRQNYNIPLAMELSQLISVHADSYTDILDVGCGTGDLTIPLASTLGSSSVYGCDISVKAITAANMASYKVDNVSFGIEDIHNLPKSWGGKYNVILMFDVLHDLQYPEKAMKQLLNVLKKDGILIIVDPKVSSDPRKNIGNIQAAQALTLSTWWCVPSSSCDHGSGNGVGWGWENKEVFLRNMGLNVRSRVCLIKSDYNYAYVCRRK
ncbi:S-adenosylmethionine-dependent methyltransferase Rv2258c-like [Ylistrum balloti]|uniref:S-adenosylmethionine-dependent methyltransferase Rv2258c-like n=1 Tax=Ylistrum balloti TaxID=509963 RepID=UPI002905A0AF|nr:S-adenosylmethionine-dependent methyltransferase Rv2258c-like [Ylistrum balloti]